MVGIPTNSTQFILNFFGGLTSVYVNRKSYELEALDTAFQQGYGALTHNTPTDAYKHAYASALISFDYGPTVSWTAVTANEQRSLRAGAHDELFMDYANNLTGINIGQHASSREEIKDSVNLALLTGELVVDPQVGNISVADAWQIDIDPTRSGQQVPVLSTDSLRIAIETAKDAGVMMALASRGIEANVDDPRGPHQLRSPSSSNDDDDNNNISPTSSSDNDTSARPSNGHNPDGGFDHSGSGTTTGSGWTSSGGEWEGGNGRQDHGTPDPSLPENPDYSGIQPIILDLGGNGVDVSFGGSASFDYDNDGFRERTDRGDPYRSGPSGPGSGFTLCGV